MKHIKALLLILCFIIGLLQAELYAEAAPQSVRTRKPILKRPAPTPDMHGPAKTVRFSRFKRIHDIPSRHNQDQLFSGHQLKISKVKLDQVDLDELNDISKLTRLLTEPEFAQYDPTKQKWTYHSEDKSKLIQFDNVFDASDYVMLQKYVHWKRERTLFNISTTVTLSRRTVSYQLPHGGLELQSPYKHGVRFCNLHLKWEAMLVLTDHVNMYFHIGYFRDSRTAAVTYDRMVEELLLRMKPTDPDLRLITKLPTNMISAQDEDRVDYHMVLAAIRKALRRFFDS